MYANAEDPRTADADVGQAEVRGGQGGGLVGESRGATGFALAATELEEPRSSANERASGHTESEPGTMATSFNYKVR